MKKYILILSLFWAGLSWLFPVQRAGGSVFGLSGHYFFGPELYFPCTDNVDLKGEDVLTFNWCPIIPARIKNYILKLYRGYDTVTENLILKQELPGGSYSFSLAAEDFSPGQVYTWQLAGVLFDGAKTDTSFCSFQMAGTAQ